jgi:8-oxo-dGTP diphosphatase
MARLTKNVKLLQKVVIVHDGQLLLLKRSMDAGSRPGAWDFPGGNAEWPQTAEILDNPHQQDAVREVLEEIGVTVNPQLIVPENLLDILTYFEPERELYSVVFIWKLDSRQLHDFDPGQIQLSDEHTEYQWVSEKDIDSFDFGEPTGTYLKQAAHTVLRKE